jgi:pre-mRNA-splicing factor SYF1
MCLTGDAESEIAQARDIYEEALASVSTVRDFSVVFDAYSQFEESMITAKMSQAGPADIDTLGDEIDMRLARYAHLPAATARRMGTDRCAGLRA